MIGKVFGMLCLLLANLFWLVSYPNVTHPSQHDGIEIIGLFFLSAGGQIWTWHTVQTVD